MAKQFLYDSLPVVETKAGKLRGYQWEGTYIFKGIRYARANRFQLPEEVEPWEGVKEAASYGFVCPMLTRDIHRASFSFPTDTGRRMKTA
ncbi:MAG: carboxylesterase family protein [Hungatella hathewayi]|uniref:carboxylesterase family protein n=1 Tax=Hungatella hathewayi TaxID=154046 RepID=UPI0039934643